MSAGDKDLAGRVRDWIKGVAYRPGWEFAVRLPGEPLSPHKPEVTVRRVALVATCFIPDLDTGLQGYLADGVPVPNTATREETLHALLAIISAIEGHERLEHFRVHGDSPFAPHGPRGDALSPLAPCLPCNPWPFGRHGCEPWQSINKEAP